MAANKSPIGEQLRLSGGGKPPYRRWIWAHCRYLTIALIFLTTLAGCAAPVPPVKRIALIAPFEGTYREIGYDALYPVKLALVEEAAPDIQLLSVDDGGSIENALMHARALANDPTVLVALVAGPIPGDPRILSALGDIPVVVVGYWNAVPDERVSVLAPVGLPAQLTAETADIHVASRLSDAVGGEIFGLKSFVALAEDPSGITVLTSATPPTDEFRDRLLASDLFVPEPGLLATLAYDAGTLAVRALSVSSTRAAVLGMLRGSGIKGINDVIRFDADGYWTDAPIYEYCYIDGILTSAD